MAIFYLGVDLGTSRTSISTSTGKRMTVRTCVGYPKDLISAKRFGNRPYLLGDEALDNRLGLNIIWPLADGVISETSDKALEATGLILKHIIAEAIPDKKPEDSIYAAIGVPANASFKNKNAIINVTKSFIDKILIVSEPFAVGYSIDRFDETLIVDIGAGTTDLCRITGSMPTEEDQLSITKAGNYLDDLLEKNILKIYPKVQLSRRVITNLKEKYGFVGVGEPVQVTLTESGIQKEYDVSQAINDSCTALTDSICAAVQQLVASFDPEFQSKLRSNIVVAGGGSRLRGLDFAIEKSLKPYGGGKVICVHDAEYCGCNGCLKMILEMPESMWERID
ncbi:MAG: rod shape-determining protein [Candidatus Riflebacteria bacterium]|nr:rod shape-determining protein [Candidatus Riflebacteria bacterium]